MLALSWRHWIKFLPHQFVILLGVIWQFEWEKIYNQIYKCYNLLKDLDKVYKSLIQIPPLEIINLCESQCWFCCLVYPLYFKTCVEFVWSMKQYCFMVLFNFKRHNHFFVSFLETNHSGLTASHFICNTQLVFCLKNQFGSLV